MTSHSQNSQAVLKAAFIYTMIPWFCVAAFVVLPLNMFHSSTLVMLACLPLAFAAGKTAAFAYLVSAGYAGPLADWIKSRQLIKVRV